MKKVFTSSLLLLLIVVLADNLKAQCAPAKPKEIVSPQAKAQKMLIKIYLRCNTTANQASKINFVYANYFRKFEEYRSTPQGPLESYELKLRRLKDNLNEKMQSILTIEQMCDWVAYQESENMED